MDLNVSWETLEEDQERHSNDYYQWGLKLATARELRDQVKGECDYEIEQKKEELEFLIAKIGSKVREDLSGKQTEKLIDSIVVQQHEVRECKGELNKLKLEKSNKMAEVNKAVNEIEIYLKAIECKGARMRDIKDLHMRDWWYNGQVN